MRDATPWYAFDTHVVGSYQEERGLRIARSMFDCTLYRVSLLPYPPTTTFPSLRPSPLPSSRLPSPDPPPSLSLPFTFIDLLWIPRFSLAILIPTRPVSVSRGEEGRREQSSPKPPSSSSSPVREELHTMTRPRAQHIRKIVLKRSSGRVSGGARRNGEEFPFSSRCELYTYI